MKRFASLIAALVIASTGWAAPPVKVSQAPQAEQAEIPEVAQATGLQLLVSTGGPTGTYSAMYKQLAARCSKDVQMTEVPSTGSQENIDRLINNQANAAFVQYDVLWLRDKTDSLKNVKTLIALHSEQVHVVVRAKSGIKTGGVAGFGGSEVTFEGFSQLANYRIGAAGGSFVTTQVIRLQSEVPFTAVRFDNDELVSKALASGQIEAALFVGGAPLARVANLGAGYRLVPFDGAVMEKLKTAYKPARLTYSTMGAAGVATVATEALFVTREYKTPKMLQALARLRSCALASVDELKDTTGTHPAWQGVESDNQGKWPYMELKSR